MRQWTYAEAAQQVEDELNLRDENLVEPAEMKGYFNKGIDEAEAVIHKLGAEDQYFLTDESLALFTDVSEYDLPETIYGNKIVSIIYNDDATRFEIRRLRGKKRFLDRADILSATHSAPVYKYLIKNPSADEGVKIELVPASVETSTTNVTVWFIRNANRIIEDDDVIDIPECMNFVLQYVKNCCKEKEGILTQKDVDDLEKQRQLMTETLSEMVPDGDNEIEFDLDHYNEAN